MGEKLLTVEFFFAGGCDTCAAARDALREAAQAAAQVEWKEVDVGKNPNRAVDVGVVSTPALAIDGDLVFKTAPTAPELQRAIQARAGRR